MENEPQGQQEKSKKRTFIQEFEVSGKELVERVKELFADSNAKRVIIRSSDGNELMSLPLTLGVVAGGLITLAAPMLAALGALAALVSRVKLQVEREADDADDAPKADSGNPPPPPQDPPTGG